MNTKKNIRVNTKKNKSTKRCNKPVRKIKKSGGNRSIRKYKSKKKYTIKKGGHYDNTSCPTAVEDTRKYTEETAETKLISEEVGTYFIIKNGTDYLLYVKSYDGTVKKYVIKQLDDGTGIDYKGSIVFKTVTDNIEDLKQILIEKVKNYEYIPDLQEQREIRKEVETRTRKMERMSNIYVTPATNEDKILMEIFGYAKFKCFNPPTVDRRLKPDSSIPPPVLRHLKP